MSASADEGRQGGAMPTEAASTSLLGGGVTLDGPIDGQAPDEIAPEPWAASGHDADVPADEETSEAAGQTCHGESADGLKETSSPGYHETKAAYLRRLRLIEGQVRGLQRMVEQDEYCIDVLTQVAATTRALHSVATALVDDHVHHCVRHAAASGDAEEIDRKIDEVMTAVKRLLK